MTQKAKTLQARIVSGSVVLLSGSGLTTGINLAYNIVVARFLGPKGFGHATVVYTILTLISAVTLSFQIIAAKVVAQQTSDEAKSAVYRGFHRASIVCGVLVALVLLLFQQAIANYLNLPDSNLIALLAVGTAFYVPLGTRRGYIQGTYGFQRLATNLVLEGAVRFGGSLALNPSRFRRSGRHGSQCGSRRRRVLRHRSQTRGAEFRILFVCRMLLAKPLRHWCFSPVRF